MDFESMTIKELRAHAKEHDINLEGRDKKSDIIETILEKGDADTGAPSGCGEDHVKAIEADRKACLKAMEK